MVKYKDTLDNTFKALADPTRRAMLLSLKSGTQRVSDLAAPFKMSLAAASKHIRILEDAGLITREIEGRQHYCTLDASKLSEAEEWLNSMATFWNSRLDALEQELLKEKPHD